MYGSSDFHLQKDSCSQLFGSAVKFINSQLQFENLEVNVQCKYSKERSYDS